MRSSSAEWISAAIIMVVLHGFFFDAVFTTWRRGFATVMLVPNL
jgi:hypothetical protein